MLRNIIAGLLGAAVLMGCATGPSGQYWQPTGVRVSRPRTIRVYVTERLSTWCSGYLPNWLACTSCDLRFDECSIYVLPRAAVASVIHHEKCHVAGYGHDEYPGVGSPKCPVDVDSIPHELVDLDALFATSK